MIGLMLKLFTLSIVVRASHVPVGNDQVQHLELAQKIAGSFNFTYGDTFTVPSSILGKKILISKCRIIYSN